MAFLSMPRSPVTSSEGPSCDSGAVTGFCVDWSAKLRRHASPVAEGSAWAPQLDEALFHDLAQVDGDPVVVALVHERGEVVEDLDQAAHVAPDDRGELVAEAGVLVPLADQPHERVDPDERILDLVRDASDHRGEQLELSARASPGRAGAGRSLRTRARASGSVPSPITG